MPSCAVAVTNNTWHLRICWQFTLNKSHFLQECPPVCRPFAQKHNSSSMETLIVLLESLPPPTSSISVFNLGFEIYRLSTPWISTTPSNPLLDKHSFVCICIFSLCGSLCIVVVFSYLSPIIFCISPVFAIYLACTCTCISVLMCVYFYSSL